MKIKIIFISLVSFCVSLTLFGQVSNVKLDHDVYSFLSKLSQKGTIEYNDLMKPISRRYVAQRLIDARGKITKLTGLQKEELKFFESEFGYEIRQIKLENKNEFSDLSLEDKEQKTPYLVSGSKKRDLLDKSWQFEVRNAEVEEDIEKDDEDVAFVEPDSDDRWRIFGYKNQMLNMNINPIVGYEVANWERSNYQNMFLGINLNGEIGNVLGFNFELLQTRQTPSIRNPLYNRFSNKTSIDYQLADDNRLEYSTINVDLGVSWDWGSLTVGKNHLNWGYAENGKIVLSDKAPSFPYIRLDIRPTDWFSFNYIHAWLNSDAIDSNSYYSSWRVKEYENTEKFSYISKFLVLHSATFSFWNGIDFSLGESSVYSDNFQIAYMIPIMFFDLVDEYLNRNDNLAGANTQLFLSLSSRNHVPNTHLYGSFHADELTPEGLFDPATQYYKFAFTLGGYTIDLPIENIGFRLEYTKVYPGNYRHFIPTLTYESSSSLLGHWIGDNGDLVYGAIDYKFMRGLKVKLWSQYIRKSTEALGNRAYKVQVPQPGFLFTDNIGDRKNYIYYGIDVDYEVFHDVWIKGHYQYLNYEQQVEKNKFSSTLFRDISFSFGYGI